MIAAIFSGDMEAISKKEIVLLTSFLEQHNAYLVELFTAKEGN